MSKAEAENYCKGKSHFINKQVWYWNQKCIVKSITSINAAKGFTIIISLIVKVDKSYIVMDENEYLDFFREAEIQEV